VIQWWAVVRVTEQSVPRLRLAFVSSGDPLSVLTWSGTPFHMLEALQSEFDVVYIERRPWPVWFDFPRRVLRRLSGASVDLYWSPFWSRLAARGVVSRIEASRPDVVIAVAITPICAALVDNGRTLFVSDATLAVMLNYNPWLNALKPWLKRSAAALESRCIQDSSLALFPSTWASESAVRDHGGSPTQVLQIPWGANLAPDDGQASQSRPLDEWRLLWIGTTWDGKGGDIVLDTIAELRRRGRPVHVDMVGSRPPTDPGAVPGVTFHGFLDKNSPAEMETLKRLYASAHLFFLPTRFDALGIAFAEAASYGVPSLSYRTGGVPSMVIDGETGKLLDEGASAEAFADAVIELLSDRARYEAMCQTAKVRARERWNWPAWAAEVRRQVESHWEQRRIGRVQRTPERRLG
jgi:glycosyltransferase involved in cell wall biosynthesis